MRSRRAVAVGVGVGLGVAVGLVWVARDARRVEAADRMELAAWSAQQKPGQASQMTGPTIQVYSGETIVDVTVTDSEGNPVHGLTRDDFTVMEDGKTQLIKSFAEFGEPAPNQPPPKLPPTVYTNLQPPSPSGAINILWLDFTNLAPTVPPEASNDPMNVETLSGSLGAQHRAKQAAKQYLQIIPSGTRMAVFGTWYPPGALRILQGVTSNPTLLSAALDTMQYDTDAMAISSETWCAQQERRNRSTLESLNQIAATLAQIKGRKNLLWFTGRIKPLVDQHPAPCLTNLFTEVQTAYGLLAAAEVTVYPISLRGVEENSTKHAQDLFGLEMVAEATGGVAYFNSNDLVGLIAKAIATGSHYYTLSYLPPDTTYDGRHHTIDIKSDKPNLHLTYRDEYHAEDPRKLAPVPGLTLATALPDSDTPDMRLAMGRSMPTSDRFPFTVQVEPSAASATPSDSPGTILGTLDPKLKGKPLVRYAFSYSIPARQFTFTTGTNNTHNGLVELDLAAFDADGHLVTGLSQAVTMSLSDDRYRQFVEGQFRFTQQLDLPPGTLFLRVGVLDRTSNKVGTLEIPLTVATGPDSVAAGK